MNSKTGLLTNEIINLAFNKPGDVYETLYIGY